MGRSRRSRSSNNSREEEAKRREMKSLTTRTGGAYIPPAKLRAM